MSDDTDRPGVVGGNELKFVRVEPDMGCVQFERTHDPGEQWDQHNAGDEKRREAFGILETPEVAMS
ncbi:hypothetical protein HNP00_000322 [Arthrobacter sp. AZCC_0090]|nr:hypothetical protein [Arthrobacter sp. AZCC_0090]